MKKTAKNPFICHITALQSSFAERGGVQFGQVMEWGAPHGHCARMLLLSFLKANGPLLWIYGHDEGVQINPAAWQSCGAKLEHFFFIRSHSPLPELRPIFLESTFKTIVIDAPKRIRAADWSFLSAKVRSNQQLLIVLQRYFLSRKQGNPHAKWRLNCNAMPARGHLRVSFVKGAEKQIHLPLQAVQAP